MKSLMRGLFWLFAIIGACVTVGGGFLYLITSDSERPYLQENKPSPDGKFKALKFQTAGGGAISPYCIESVVVVPTDTPNEWKQDVDVFSADCSVKVTFDWASAMELKIGYTPKLATRLQFYMRGADATRQVRVSYEVR